MDQKILIIGNTSETYHVGSMLFRAAQNLNISVVSHDNNHEKYAPSLKYTVGKIFNRLNGKRPFEWWSFNRNAITLVEHESPQIMLVTGIFPLSEELFDCCHHFGVKSINFLTDDPWAKPLYNKRFITNLRKYDLVVSTKSRVIPDLLKCGAKNTIFLPYAYDPYWHRLPDPVPDSKLDKFTADVSFVGNGDQDRLEFLQPFASLENLKLKLFGNTWDKIFTPGWEKHSEVLSNEFRLAMYHSKISLGLLRKRSRDDSTQRTFEIAPCGGCGIYQDTPEHRNILAGYPEYGFFSSPNDLVDKCNWLLLHPYEREEMRKLGIKLIVKEENTFAARLQTILRKLGDDFLN
ncbi:MAG: glycosyltransferase [SAR324 cluster bacterium]|nr:glycosyltransferase [SAR324 cluster bacterium]